MSRRDLAASYPDVHSEGGILPMDLLQRVALGDPDVPGVKNTDYDLVKQERLGEAINRSWSRMLGLWKGFSEARGKLAAGDPASGMTRNRLLLPLFQEFGYGRLMAGRKGFDLDDKHFAITHAHGSSPIHLLGCGLSLDRREKGVAGAAASSPHGLVQEFLNLSDDHLWGFLSNGLELRVMRDHFSLSRQAYVSFDLEAIFEGEQYSEFRLLWMVCHQSRVAGERPEECWLEKWFQRSRDEGVRALDRLRGGVETAIAHLGTGFLAHRANVALRDALESGDLDRQEYYRQLLRLVYRLIFIFVAEERGALLDPGASKEAQGRYLRFYSTGRLRRLARRRRGTTHADLWRALGLVMRGLSDGCPDLALPALGSYLWSDRAIPSLAGAEIANEHLLAALRSLAYVEDGKQVYPVNWRNVGAEELGSIYESLLELHPRLNRQAATFELESAAGHERKTTGSYYTPTSLVDCLLDSALDPVLDEAARKPNAEAAILGLKVCDPACGSGHFLVAAARRIAKRLARVRSGDDEPAPEVTRTALRDVVGRCIFGVDLNEMAVELCKVSLWMEALEPGKPLSFLKGHILQGNSLLGTTPALMARGIPDDAFKPIEGDDKKVASALKKQNKKERKGQMSMFEAMAAERPVPVYNTLAKRAQWVDRSRDDTIEALQHKEQEYDRLQESPDQRTARDLANAWCSAFVWPKTPGMQDFAITENLWKRMQRDVTAAPQATRAEVRRLAKEYDFFHWHLAFPQVLYTPKEGDAAENEDTGWSGGFDVVLGNPPWDRIKLQEKEFFAIRSSEIAGANNAAARKKLIRALPDIEPELWRDWIEARRQAEGESHLVRDTGRFPLCGRGDVNTYSVFAELNRSLIPIHGYMACIIPSGIATDATTRDFFRDLIGTTTLVSFFGFENEGHLFEGVDHRVNFCILTVAGISTNAGALYSAFLRHPRLLREEDKVIRLTAADISQINPNTETCPVFRTSRDAEITKGIYRRVPILIREARGDKSEANSWGIRFMTMFHMANDSSLFRSHDQLMADGWTLEGNSFRRGKERCLPLYEAKMVSIFDNRHGDFGLLARGKREHILPRVPINLLSRPDYAPLSRYWVDEQTVRQRVSAKGWNQQWFFGWRDVTDARSSVRTLISTLIPWAATSHKYPLIISKSISLMPFLTACLSSFVVDYQARQKLGGVSMTYFVLKQLPVLPPKSCHEPTPWLPKISLGDWILANMLELTFTTWNLKPFAQDCGYDGPPYRWDEDRRFLLRAELDAAFFHLYGIARDDVDYIMETFPIVKRRDEKAHGEYRTKRVILEVYEEMQQAMDTGQPYQTRLDPPPADPRVAHPPREAGVSVVESIWPTEDLPDGAWIRPAQNPMAENTAMLAAVLKGGREPTPSRQVRLAAIIGLQPNLLLPFLYSEQARTWRRLVGKEAEPEPDGVIRLIPAVDRAWGDAVNYLLSSSSLVDDPESGTWAAGPAVQEIPTEGWAVGRARVVMAVIRDKGLSTILDELPEGIRRWVNAEAA